jgi:hypothetical protein
MELGRLQSACAVGSRCGAVLVLALARLLTPFFPLV